MGGYRLCKVEPLQSEARNINELAMMAQLDEHGMMRLGGVREMVW